ncbi:MAG: prepilin peptidase [Candidatus Doudnabacteria bacterium]|nr:prepilin peptidase [Candidatus Doudnabacteria bacterium]
MITFFSLAAFIFGSAIGSFLNVLTLRLPEEESLGGRSHCPSCKHILSSSDLVPLFSFLWLRGKCRYCKTKISARYFMVELATALLFAWVYAALLPESIFGIVILIRYWFVAAVFVSVFVIDLEHFVILDKMVLLSSIVVASINIILSIIAGSSVFSINGLFISGLVGAVAGFLPFYALWFVSKGKWLGFGDVKFALLLGLILGWPQIYVGYFFAIMIGGFVSSILLIFTKKSLKSRLPFGTFLTVGAFLAMLYGPLFLKWYLAFLGF